MNGLRKLRAALATLVAAAMFTASMPIAVVRAEMVPTDRVVDRMTIEAKREEVATFLMREEVSRQIADMGVKREEADARVAGMTDAEILQVAGKIEQIPAGQAQGVSLTVLLLLIIIIIILV